VCFRLGGGGGRAWWVCFFICFFFCFLVLVVGGFGGGGCVGGVWLGLSCVSLFLGWWWCWVGGFGVEGVVWWFSLLFCFVVVLLGLVVFFCSFGPFRSAWLFCFPLFFFFFFFPRLVFGFGVGCVGVVVGFFVFVWVCWWVLGGWVGGPGFCVSSGLGVFFFFSFFFLCGASWFFLGFGVSGLVFFFVFGCVGGWCFGWGVGGWVGFCCCVGGGCVGGGLFWWFLLVFFGGCVWVGVGVGCVVFFLVGVFVFSFFVFVVFVVGVLRGLFLFFFSGFLCGFLFVCGGWLVGGVGGFGFWFCFFFFFLFFFFFFCLLCLVCVFSLFFWGVSFFVRLVCGLVWV